MEKRPSERGQGVIEWILIVILALMILVTIYLLLRPSLAMLWQNFIESAQ